MKLFNYYTFLFGEFKFDSMKLFKYVSKYTSLFPSCFFEKKNLLSRFFTDHPESKAFQINDIFWNWIKSISKLDGIVILKSIVRNRIENINYF